jgi:hypothetical protein
MFGSIFNISNRTKLRNVLPSPMPKEPKCKIELKQVK